MKNGEKTGQKPGAGRKHSGLLSGKEIGQVFQLLSSRIIPKAELHYTTSLDLLIAVVLSAQTTDKAVNQVTEPLWERCRTVQDYLELGEEELQQAIRTIGLYRNKAKSVIRLCQKLRDEYNGEVPDSFAELVKLPGVGRKTANVVLNVAFGQPTLAVDTHVFRVSNRIGLVEARTPEETELQALPRIPAEYRVNAHHYLLLHGRYCCTAQHPHCQDCIIRDLCKRRGL